MSKQVVKYRIERLEKLGIIRGYYSLIDTSRLGMTSFRTYIKLRNTTKEQREKIVGYLKKQKNIWAVVLMSGKWDIALGIGVESIYQYYEIWESILKKYLKNIHDYKTSVYSPIFHYACAYLTEKGDSSPIRVLGGGKKQKFDKGDVDILIQISKNARISLVDLSEKVNLSTQTLSQKIKQLEKVGIIQGYRANIDVGKLGYKFYKTEIRLSDYNRIDSLLDFCHMHPNIYQVDKTIGGETIEIEFHVKSLSRMHEIIEEINKKFNNIIERLDYLDVLSFEKATFMPEDVLE